MSKSKKIILNVNPQSHCRATKGDSIFFRIPREKLRPDGLRRLLRLERYNNYKLDLLAEAKKKNFTIPAYGMSVTFYIPVPKSWSNKKKKQYHGTFCQSRPDLDNLVKSLMDSLLDEDKYVANLTATKRWVDFPSGWIEISLIDEPLQEVILPPAKE